MAEIDRSGFEVDAVADDGWTSIIGTGQSISTAKFKSGAKSLRFNPTADDSIVKLTFSGNAIVVLGASLNFTSFPAGDAWLLRFENVGETGPAASVKYDQGNNRLVLDITDGVSSSTSVGPTSLTADTWYTVGLLLNTGSNPWDVQWRVNSTSYTTLTPAWTAATWANFYNGFYQSVTADMHEDEYVLFTGSTGDYPPVFAEPTAGPKVIVMQANRATW